LKVDFLLRCEPQVALLGDLRIVINKSNTRETNERKKRQQNKGVSEIGPQQRRHGGRKNNQYAAHRRRARLFLVLLRAFFPDELANLQFAKTPDEHWAKD